MRKKSVLIIGASRGIGLGFANVFTSKGWDVHVTIRNESATSGLPKVLLLEVNII